MNEIQTIRVTNSTLKRPALQTRTRRGYQYANDWGSGATYKMIKNDTITYDVADFDLLMYPNPVTRNFTLLFDSDGEETMNFLLLNSIGKAVVVKRLNIKEGENMFQFDRNDLPDGIYFVQLNFQSGKTKTIKLIFK